MLLEVQQVPYAQSVTSLPLSKGAESCSEDDYPMVWAWKQSHSLTSSLTRFPKGKAQKQNFFSPKQILETRTHLP